MGSGFGRPGKGLLRVLDSQIAVEGGQVLWDITTIDDDIARAILDEYYDLPDSAGADPDELERRLSAKGLQFIGTPGSTVTQALGQAHSGMAGAGPVLSAPVTSQTPWSTPIGPVTRQRSRPVACEFDRRPKTTDGCGGYSL